MPAALDQLTQASAPVPLTDAVALSGFLGLVPDPRGVRGRRYQLSALVAAAAASVLAGARSLTAITEWIADAPAWACRALGFPLDPLTGTVSVPHPHTLRRLLVKLDGDALDQAIGAFLTARTCDNAPAEAAVTHRPGSPGAPELSQPRAGTLRPAGWHLLRPLAGKRRRQVRSALRRHRRGPTMPATPRGILYWLWTD
ncbi:transposase family protein [Streptomyces sp. NPDC020792]|uniref:transposase family protein n=1 Tax=Streptomyces sp. NPDC020792 TaxID=3365089 RepID=UPI003797C15B